MERRFQMPYDSFIYSLSIKHSFIVPQALSHGLKPAVWGREASRCLNKEWTDNSVEQQQWQQMSRLRMAVVNRDRRVIWRGQNDDVRSTKHQGWKWGARSWLKPPRPGTGPEAPGEDPLKVLRDEGSVCRFLCLSQKSFNEATNWEKGWGDAI